MLVIMKKVIYFLLFLPLIVVSQIQDLSKLKGPYLGQKPPGMTPTLFAPGIVSRIDYFGWRSHITHVM